MSLISLNHMYTNLIYIFLITFNIKGDQIDTITYHVENTDVCLEVAEPLLKESTKISYCFSSKVRILRMKFLEFVLLSILEKDLHCGYHSYPHHVLNFKAYFIFYINYLIHLYLFFYRHSRNKIELIESFVISF